MLGNAARLSAGGMWTCICGNHICGAYWVLTWCVCWLAVGIGFHMHTWQSWGISGSNAAHLSAGSWRWLSTWACMHTWQSWGILGPNEARLSAVGGGDSVELVPGWVSHTMGLPLLFPMPPVTPYPKLSETQKRGLHPSLEGRGQVAARWRRWWW